MSTVPNPTATLPVAQNFQTYRNIFNPAKNWITQSGLDINPIPSAAFTATQQPDGTMLVSNALTQQMAGALVTLKLPMPPPNLPYVGLDFLVKFPGTTVANVARFETDVNICFIDQSQITNPTLPNVAMLGTQLNLSTGQYQIDPAWTDTGFVPGPIPPDIWFPCSFRHWIDYPNKKASTLSISWNGVKYMIPSGLQGVPWKPLKWATVTASQLQNEGFNIGSVLILYDQGVLTFSDQPF